MESVTFWIAGLAIFTNVVLGFLLYRAARQIFDIECQIKAYGLRIRALEGINGMPSINRRPPPDVPPELMLALSKSCGFIRREGPDRCQYLLENEAHDLGVRLARYLQPLNEDYIVRVLLHVAVSMGMDSEKARNIIRIKINSGKNSVDRDVLDRATVEIDKQIFNSEPNA